MIEPPGRESDRLRTTTHVAFIGATGRSGSTLLARVLGTVPNVCSVGELCWIWAYGVIQDRACGCGLAFSQCPFWTEVGRSAYGGFHNIDAHRANDLRRCLTKNGRLPELLGRARPSTRHSIEEFTALMAPLYAAIREVSGARVVVDNSKQAAVALLTRKTPGVDLDVIHLVRRSHGVAYSWTKHVARSDNSGAEMRRRGPGRSALRWTVDNGLYELVGRTGSPRVLVRYEDFVVNPRAEVGRMLSFLDLPVESAVSLFTTDGRVNIATDHSVWGNPMRLRSGPERLRSDEAWRTALDPKARRLVSVISAPSLARYGYLLP